MTSRRGVHTNELCIRVLTLGVLRVGDELLGPEEFLDADVGAWHRLFYDMKQEGIAPEVIGQLTFQAPSGGRPYSQEVEQLLHSWSIAGIYSRQNPEFQRQTMRSSETRSNPPPYSAVVDEHSDDIERISKVIAEAMILR